MTEESASSGPAPELPRPPERRRRAGRRAYINIPGLARRGRATLRQVVALLFGGYVATVEGSRRRGARGILFRLRAMTAWIFRLFLKKEIARQPFPVQLRMRLEILGPTYVKLGQILSLRQDILPDVVTSELRNLLSDLPPVSYEDIHSIVEADLGRPVEDIFAEVDPVPLGSASIAQSHWARLLIIPRYQPRRVIDEFCEYTLREVEMTLEAENAETFSDNFANNVLCMEYLYGKRPDATVVSSMPIEERRHLIDLGAEAIIRMLYQDGFFHADLHPANLLVLPEVKVGFLDLGMVGHFDPELRHNLLELFYAMVMEDFEGAARHLAAVSHSDPRSDVPGFRRAVKEVARRWRRQARFEDFSLALLILECIQLGARYHLYFPVDMVLMVKALVTYEGVGYLLDPDFNVAEVSERHIRHIFRQEYSPARLMKEGLRVAPDLFDAALKLPLLVSEGLSMMEERTRRKPQRPLTGVRATLYGGACMVAGAILIGLDGPWLLAVLLFTVGVLLPLRRGD
jgi:ubiquinone biosynthesis protein